MEYISIYLTVKIGTEEMFSKDIMELGCGLNWLMTEIYVGII
jgi:hypothetical protein